MSKQLLIYTYLVAWKLDWHWSNLLSCIWWSNYQVGFYSTLSHFTSHQPFHLIQLWKLVPEQGRGACRSPHFRPLSGGIGSSIPCDPIHIECTWLTQGMVYEWHATFKGPHCFSSENFLQTWLCSWFYTWRMVLKSNFNPLIPFSFSILSTSLNPWIKVWVNIERTKSNQPELCAAL